MIEPFLMFSLIFVGGFISGALCILIFSVKMVKRDESKLRNAKAENRG